MLGRLRITIGPSSHNNEDTGVSRNTAPAAPAPNTAISYTELAAKVTKCKSEMRGNRNLFLS